MARTPEAKVKDAVKTLLKAEGIHYIMPVSNGMGVVGVPDFLCVWKGRFLAIETKAPGKRNNTTANQDRQLEAIRRCGGIAIVIDDVEQLRECLHESE